MVYACLSADPVRESMQKATDKMSEFGKIKVEFLYLFEKLPNW